MTQSHDAGPPLSRWEIVGAWLGIWTPPRGAQIPPVPWRKIGIWTGIVLVATAIVAVIAVPRIDSGKRAGAERDQAALSKAQAAERARVVRSQTPHRGHAARPSGAITVADREALFGSAQAAVLADARARVRSGALPSPVDDLVCGPIAGSGDPPHPERNRAVGLAAYDCTAVTGHIKATKQNVAGALGYPFRLKVDFNRWSYVWCKQTPLPGEQVIPDPRGVVPLPKVCRV